MERVIIYGESDYLWRERLFMERVIIYGESDYFHATAALTPEI